MTSRRDWRLASGLVLFSYVTLHLVCHALGLASVKTAEQALHTTLLLWHSAPGTVLLYGAASVHIGLALLAVYERRTLRMPPAQLLRIVLGLTMPIVLIGHFIGTRYAFDHFGLLPQYQRVVARLWANSAEGRQLALLAPGWLHGCMGLNYAFSSRPWWPHMRFLLFALALLLPVLAALGFLNMGRELAQLNAYGGTYGSDPTLVTSPEQGQALEQMRINSLAIYAGLVTLAVLARLLRDFIEHQRRAAVRIQYPQREVSVPRGWTVLEASRSFGIAHQSMCGGRARCSTCRVRVLEGLAHCPEPNDDERQLLERIAAPEGVRLACQLRPTGNIAIKPLLEVERPWWRDAPQERPSVDRELAVLTCRLRLPLTTPASPLDVTSEAASDATLARSAAHSAHDEIYAVDRFHAIVRSAIMASGGVRCRFGADHWMCAFGADGGALRLSCAQALQAARQIEAEGLALIVRLRAELDFHADFSLALHAGHAVVGTLAADEERVLSAVGATLREAEALQAIATQRGARFVISQVAAEAAGMATTAWAWSPAAAHDDDIGAAAPFTLAASPAALKPHPASD